MAKRKDVQLKDKAEQKKKKVEPKEEESEEESEEVEAEEVKSNGKKDKKEAKAETPKKAGKKNKAEEKMEEDSEEKETKGKKGGKKAEGAKKDGQKKKKQESDEESEEEKPKVKANKAAEKKKPAKKEESEEESEEEKPKKEVKKTEKKAPEPKGKKEEKKKPAKEESEDEDEDEDEKEEKEEKVDEEDEEEKPVAKGNATEEKEDSGFVIKSAASGSGLKTRPGATPQGQNPPSNTLFVGNLSFKITDENIKEFFSDCGKVTAIRWNSHRDTGKFKGTGFVEFDSVESATKGMQKNESDLLGRPVRLDFASPAPAGRKDRPKEKPEGTHTVFIGNCPDSIDDDDVYKLFASVGSIQKVRWVTDKQTGNFKGCGFVVFESTESTDKAVAMAGAEVKGKTLRIDFATD